LDGESTRTRNPEGTRRAVLDAAERLFADRGFAGTSMRDIATASGISQPLIHHHFGCKHELYEAVRRQVAEEFVRRFPEVVSAPPQPLDAAEELTRVFLFFKDNMRLLRLLGWARLEEQNAQVVPEEAALNRAMVARIEAAQAAGLIRTDINPVYLSAMLLSLIVHWLDNHAYFASLLPAGADDDAYLRQAIALVQRGLEPCTPSRSGAGATIPSSAFPGPIEASTQPHPRALDEGEPKG
jgi:TetR/AcrR family transcriptional regulator